LVLFIKLFQNRTFGEKWQTFLWVECPSPTETKHKRKPKNGGKPMSWLHPLILLHQTPDGMEDGPFALAV